eukprot:scaffold516_cov401-Prasinococcus_capsulatus_cf.AAC.21
MFPTTTGACDTARSVNVLVLFPKNPKTGDARACPKLYAATTTPRKAFDPPQDCNKGQIHDRKVENCTAERKAAKQTTYNDVWRSFLACDVSPSKDRKLQLLPFRWCCELCGSSGSFCRCSAGLSAICWSSLLAGQGTSTPLHMCVGEFKLYACRRRHSRIWGRAAQGLLKARHCRTIRRRGPAAPRVLLLTRRKGRRRRPPTAPLLLQTNPGEPRTQARWRPARREGNRGADAWPRAVSAGRQMREWAAGLGSQQQHYAALPGDRGPGPTVNLPPLIRRLPWSAALAKTVDLSMRLVCMSLL